MNAGDKLPKDQMAALRAEDLQLYLSSRGWLPDPVSTADLATVYRLPAEPAAEILVPRRRDLADYPSRMADAAQMLAAVERRSVWQVLNDLAAPPADVLRLRVRSPDTASGTLPLEEGIRLWQGSWDMLLAAAHSAHQPQPYYPRQTYAPALHFLRTCRLGQSERGSYVATILAPVPPTLQPSLYSNSGNGIVPADEPYERRVTLHLMEALGAIRTALEIGKHAQLLQEVSRGVSANLCGALASMQPNNPQASLEVHMAWSRNRPRVPAHLRSTLSFSQGEFAIISEASRQLREGVAPRREKVVGVVISLHAEPAKLFTEFEGRVIVRAEVEGHSTRVEFVLKQGDYERACDAHRDKQRVSVTGILKRDPTKRMFELLQPQEFHVLQGT